MFHHKIDTARLRRPVFFGPKETTELYPDKDAWSAVDRNTKADAFR